MSTNPYEPPESEASPERRPPRAPRSPLAAVIAGLAVDIGGSLLVGVVISVMYAAQLQAQGLSDREMVEALKAMPPDSGLYMAGLLLGLALSVAGGYVCARVARRDEWKPGLVMAATATLFGLVIDGGAGDQMMLLVTVTSFACNLLGVKFGADHNRRAEAPSP